MKRLPIVIATLVAVACVIFFSVRYYLDSQLPRATALIQVVGPIASAEEEVGHIEKGPGTLASILSDLIERSLDAPEVTQAAQDAGITKDGQIDHDRLMEIATAAPVRETDIIEIVVKHESRKNAVLLANAFADAAVRMQKEHNRSRLHALKEELAEQEKDFETKGGNLRSLMEGFSVQVPRIGQSFPSLDSLPKFLNEQPADFLTRQTTYQNTLNAFQESKANLKEVTISFSKKSANLIQSAISVVIHTHAR